MNHELNVSSTILFNLYEVTVGSVVECEARDKNQTTALFLRLSQSSILK